MPERVVALFGPTATGKTAVARVLRRAPRRRGRLGGLRRALRRHSRCSRRRPPIRRVSSASSRSTAEVSVGEYQRARARRGRRDPRGRPHADRRRRDRALPEGRPRRARAAAGARSRARASAGAPSTTSSAPRAHTRFSPSATRRRRRASTRTTAAASSARSSSPRPVRRSRPAEDRLWSDELPPADAPRRPRPRARGSRRADRALASRRCSSTARSRRRGAAWAGELSATARKVLGLEELATLPAGEAGGGDRDRDHAGSPATSGSGCAVFPSSLLSTRTVHPEGSPMRSSRWQAQGNVYLVAEEPLTAERVRAEVGDADGILEVRDRGDDWVQIAVWNPDGSLAEMSGNGTRIAARWLAERTGATERDRVGRRRARSRPGCSATGSSSRSSARSRSERSTRSRASASRRSTSGTLTPSSRAILPISTGSGRSSRRIRAFPNRTNVQVARRVDEHTIEARVWERGVGETGASGTSAIAVAAAFGADAVTVRVPGRRSPRRVEGSRARLTGPAERGRASILT